MLGGVPVIGFGEATPEGADIYSREEIERQWRNEKLLLVTLRDWLEAKCDENTTLAGWNLKGFDLPRLRMMYLRHKLRLPVQLRARADVYDMMKEYCKNFSVDRAEFMKLAVALEQVGIASRKAEINGSMVGQWIRERKYEEVLNYALSDINEETELFLRMTGKSEQLV